MKLSIFLTASILIVGCADQKEQVLDRRDRPALAADAEANAGAPNSDADANPENPTDGSDGGDNSGVQPTVIDDQILNFSGINFRPAAGNDLITEEQRANFLAVSKVDAQTSVIFGRDGNSWSYGPESTAPTLIRPPISKPDDATLLSLPDGDLWMISPNRVSKRKIDPELPPTQVVLHNFDLTKLSGDVSQIRVLGATRQSLLLFMGTHIALFEVIDGVTAAYEFLAQIPGAEGEGIVAAGQLEGGGYWLATDQEKFALLRLIDNVWRWNLANVAIGSLEGFNSLGAWVDPAAQGFVGDIVALSAGQVFSVSGAPIAVMAAP